MKFTTACLFLGAALMLAPHRSELLFFRTILMVTVHQLPLPRLAHRAITLSRYKQPGTIKPRSDTITALQA